MDPLWLLFLMLLLNDLHVQQAHRVTWLCFPIVKSHRKLKGLKRKTKFMPVETYKKKNHYLTWHLRYNDGNIFDFSLMSTVTKQACNK